MGKKRFLPTNHLLVVSWSSKHHHLHQRWSPLKPHCTSFSAAVWAICSDTRPRRSKAFKRIKKMLHAEQGYVNQNRGNSLALGMSCSYFFFLLLLCWGEFVRPREHVQNKHHPSLCRWVKLLWALKSIQIAHLRSSLRSEWCALLLPSQVLKWLDSWMNIGLMSEKIWNEVD